jgi:preprotein translocase subunit YajC
MIDVAWAQEAAGGSPPPMIGIMPILLIVVVFYFLLFRPQQQKAKEHRTLLANLKKNDEVITNGGLYGRVVGLADDVVNLEIAPNVRVRVSRPQIASVVSQPTKAGDNKPNPEKEKDKPK